MAGPLWRARLRAGPGGHAFLPNHVALVAKLGDGDGGGGDGAAAPFERGAAVLFERVDPNTSVPDVPVALASEQGEIRVYRNCSCGDVAAAFSAVSGGGGPAPAFGRAEGSLCVEPVPGGAGEGARLATQSTWGPVSVFDVSPAGSAARLWQAPAGRGFAKLAVSRRGLLAAPSADGRCYGLFDTRVRGGAAVNFAPPATDGAGEEFESPVGFGIPAAAAFADGGGGGAAERLAVAFEGGAAVAVYDPRAPAAPAYAPPVVRALISDSTTALAVVPEVEAGGAGSEGEGGVRMVVGTRDGRLVHLSCGAAGAGAQVTADTIVDFYHQFRSRSDDQSPDSRPGRPERSQTRRRRAKRIAGGAEPGAPAPTPLELEEFHRRVNDCRLGIGVIQPVHAGNGGTGDSRGESAYGVEGDCAASGSAGRRGPLLLLGGWDGSLALVAADAGGGEKENPLCARRQPPQQRLTPPLQLAAAAPPGTGAVRAAATLRNPRGGAFAFVVRSGDAALEVVEVPAATTGRQASGADNG